MKELFNSIQRNFLLYCTIFLSIGSLQYTIFTNAKKAILEEQVSFLEEQIPSLQSQNAALLISIKKSIRKKRSYIDKFNELSPVIENLMDHTSNTSYENLSNINSYLLVHHDTPDLLQKAYTKNLSTSWKTRLQTYSTLKFTNELLNYLAQYVGTHTSMILSNKFNFIDFWSKDKYHVYINFRPENIYETDIRINGKVSEYGRYSFTPKKSGTHTFDIQFSQYDAKGTKKEFSFSKEIFVNP
ncbi:MAG: hypothetical protein P1U56_08540 [Saprospiraceae bacterium]|nr:hypothetical protein [Saprospiraceae bacterium]